MYNSFYYSQQAEAEGEYVFILENSAVANK